MNRDKKILAAGLAAVVLVFAGGWWLGSRKPEPRPVPPTPEDCQRQLRETARAIVSAFRDAPDTRERPWDVALAAAALHAHRERAKAVHAAESGPGGSAWRTSTWRSSGDRRP